MITLLLNIAFLHLMGLLSPGPDFFYVSRTGASRGMKFALAASLGISLGVIFWAISSVLGLSLLFKQFPLSKGILLASGGGYLLYLGGKLLSVRHNISFENQTEQAQLSLMAEVRKGLWVNLSNAKAVAYFASVMSILLASINGITPIIAVISLILLETFVYFCLVGLLFSRPVVRNLYAQYSRYIDNAAGGIFALFGFYLIYNGVMLMVG